MCINMQIYAIRMHKNAINICKICTKYAINMQKYAMPHDYASNLKISKKYAKNMQKISKYMPT